MKKRLLVIGGHGSGEVAMSVFRDYNIVKNEWIIEGFLSDVKTPGEYLGKYKIVGATEEILDYVNKGYYIHYALHFHAKKKYERVKQFKQFNIPLEANASVVHPKAYINPSTKIGYGVSISPFVYTSISTEVGNYVHIYPHATLSHESVVADFCTVAVHTVVGGRDLLEEGVHAGANSCIREDVKIGRYSILGLGSTVIKDVKEFSIVAGNPAKMIGKVRQDVECE